MYQINVFVHILSAIIWVGGMLFLALVLVPATRHFVASERGTLFHLLGERFRTVGWICIALLIVTGIGNLAFRGVDWGSVVSGRLFGSQFGQVLAAKLSLVAVMLVMSAIHDFVIGPTSTRVSTNPETARSPEASRLRRRASMLARINALLALIVIFLAVALVRGLPWD